MNRLFWILVASAAVVLAQDKQTVGTNIELTVYLIAGSAQGTADEVPQDLEPTMKQLHSVFAYKSYKLSESFILRGRAGRANTEGIVPGNGLHYRFGYNVLRVSGDPPRAVHIDGLNLMLTRTSIRAGKEETETIASIYTDLDVRDGQKTVVGKSSLNIGGDALILVIVPKVIK
jgi:hypothetical protein